MSASDLRQVRPSPVPVPLFRSLHSFGLSLCPSSRQPQFDPAIFSVWCTIIRPSLHSLGPLTPFLSLSLSPVCSALLCCFADSSSPRRTPFLSLVPLFSLPLRFLLSALRVMLFVSEPPLYPCYRSVFHSLSLTFFFLAIRLKIAVSWAGGASNSGA